MNHLRLALEQCGVELGSGGCDAISSGRTCCHVHSVRASCSCCQRRSVLGYIASWLIVVDRFAELVAELDPTRSGRVSWAAFHSCCKTVRVLPSHAMSVAMVSSDQCVDNIERRIILFVNADVMFLACDGSKALLARNSGGESDVHV